MAIGPAPGRKAAGNLRWEEKRLKCQRFPLFHRQGPAIREKSSSSFRCIEWRPLGCSGLWHTGKAATSPRVLAMSFILGSLKGPHPNSFREMLDF